MLFEILFLSLLGSYEESYERALRSNVPLIVAVNCDPAIPKGCIGCRVESFDRAKDGDTVTMIPSEGKMYRVSCKPEEAEAVRQSWSIVDALDEVNAQRTSRGLRPFQRDHHLTLAAASAAKFRAAHHMAGHTANDFAYIPSGGSATAAGCAAWPASMPFGSCCLYENYTTAGASYAIGSDGLRYCHLYVR